MNSTTCVGLLLLVVSMNVHAMESSSASQQVLTKLDEQDLPGVTEVPRLSLPKVARVKVIPVILDEDEEVEEVEEHLIELSADEMIELVEKLVRENKPAERLLKYTRLQTGLETSEEGVSFLHYACAHGTLELVEKLLSLGSNRERARSLVTRDTQETLLHFAAEAGKTATVELLINDVLIEVDSEDQEGRTALSMVNNDAPACAELLIELQADVNHLDKGGASPLHYATFFERKTIVKCLLDHGASVDVLSTGESPTPRTPLYNAVENRNRGLITLLLARKADPNIAGPSGYTPLHLAADLDAKRSIVLPLLEAGAASRPCALKQRTPLMYAVLKSNAEVIPSLFCDTHLNENHQDYKGRTALHLAAKKKDILICSMLIDQQVSKSIRDNDGKLAADYAPANSELQKLLLPDAQVRKKKERGKAPRMSVVGKAARRRNPAQPELTQTKEEENEMEEESSATSFNRAVWIPPRKAHHVVRENITHEQEQVTAQQAERGDSPSSPQESGSSDSEIPVVRGRAPRKSVAKRIVRPPKEASREFTKSEDEDEEEESSSDGWHGCLCLGTGGTMQEEDLPVEGEEINAQQSELPENSPAREEGYRTALELIDAGLLEDALISVRDVEQDLLGTDGYGRTLLHHAMKHESWELVDMLLERAPDLINMRDNNGKTALHRACKRNNERLVARLLQEKKCLISAQDKSGKKPSDLTDNETIKLVLNFFSQNLASPL